LRLLSSPPVARPVDIGLSGSEALAAGRRRRRAHLRFALANARMFAAAVAIVLLITTGLTWATVAAALASFTLSAVARSLPPVGAAADPDAPLDPFREN
jgi:hypothetical protein